MTKIDNQKLFDHIDGAKEWLDKAKAEYNSANLVGGELILNLAGAEIKYARELSRSRYVLTEKKSASGRFIKLALPIAASIILLSGIAFWLQTGQLNPSKRVSTLQTSVTPVSNELKTVDKNGDGNSTEKLAAVNTQPDNSKPENEMTPVKSKPQAVKSLRQLERTVINSENKIIANQNRVADNSTQPNLQPVSQLAIDEEALTKEAFHSLRNGK